MTNLAKEIVEEIEKRNITSREEVDKLKAEISHKYKAKHSPKLINLLLEADNKQRKKLKQLLTTKPIRTISGVAPLALFTAPLACPPQAQCIFCPGGPGSVFGNVPKSYTGNEPASRRAARNKYDPYLQIFNRLEHYVLLNQDFEKVEVIIMGGTFTFYPKKYKLKFMTEVFQALNDFSAMFFNNNELDLESFKSFFELPADLDDKERTERIHEKLLKLKKESYLKEEQIKNETAKVRCVALVIETRPDCGLLDEGNEILDFGGTRVELGIQSVYNEDLEFVKRGHSVEDSIKSVRILRDLGFKLSFHYMLGLTEDRKKDLEGLKEIFSNPDFMPDMVKIYPCLVMPGTELYKRWQEGKYKPLKVEETAEMIAEAKKFIPNFVRIQRIQRDIPHNVIAAGPIETNLRQRVQNICKKNNIHCQCIRCREPMNKEISWNNVQLKKQGYSASQGKEIFLSFEDLKNNIILGFVRLRIPSQQLREEITKDSAIIREIHVYSPAVALGKKDISSVQHQGLGKKLLKEAERITKEEFQKNKLLVISGVGVREYFYNLGYKRDGPYVSKILS